MIDRAVMAYKETETDVLYGVAVDRAVMAYKGTETDVLYGVEMALRADATAHARLHFLTAK